MAVYGSLTPYKLQTILVVNNIFLPNKVLSRAASETTLRRYAGQPVVNSAHPNGSHVAVFFGKGFKCFLCFLVMFKSKPSLFGDENNHPTAIVFKGCLAVGFRGFDPWPNMRVYVLEASETS